MANAVSTCQYFVFLSLQAVALFDRLEIVFGVYFYGDFKHLSSPTPFLPHLRNGFSADRVCVGCAV